jgi:D-alanyl-D-alanine-carboxypeptidase/D-alanyl-D-alanine-endopeptidase
MAKWLRHNLATSDPAAWSVLTLAHAIYRQRQTMPAAIGFDEAGPIWPGSGSAGSPWRPRDVCR